MAAGTFTLLPDGLWQLRGETHCRIEKISSKSMSFEDRVITLSPAAKSRLLSTKSHQQYLSRDTPEAILNQVKVSSIASQFGLKAVALSDAPFRLLKRLEPHATLEQDISFIALSYCWHDGLWDRGANNPFTVPFTVPIATDLFQALLTERVNPSEGIWIDQLCINQTDEEEKILAIGSIDVIYKSARLVVVALEDILIDEDEEAALHELTAKYEREELWLPDADVVLCHCLTKLMWKIFTARWFTRAWCGHELRVSHNQIFLIRAGQPDTPSHRVVKITAAFLNDLSFIEARLESIRPTETFATIKRRCQSRRSQFCRHMLLSLRRLPGWADDSREDETKVRSHMRAFADVFTYDASVTADKLAITLNVVDCGLYLKSRPQTTDECCYIFYHIALAAGDPTALATTGRQLLANANWMRWPLLDDIVEPFIRGTRHPRLEQVPQFQKKELILDLIFLGSSQDLQRASLTNTFKAENVIRACVSLFQDDGTWLFDGIYYDSPDFTVKKKFCVDLLACALECGDDWIVESARNKGITDDDTLEPALSFVNSVDFDEWEKYPESEDHLHAIFDFVGNLIDLWLLNRNISDSCPAWFQTGSGPIEKSLILHPRNSEFQVAIPVLLLRPEYNFLKRIWFVKQEHLQMELSDMWVVVDKTASFGTADFVRLARSQALRQRQRIIG
jgi:hypothetical protein